MVNFIRPAVLTKKEANEQTMFRNNKHYAQRKIYLKNHNIIDALKLAKKFDKDEEMGL